MATSWNAVLFKSDRKRRLNISRQHAILHGVANVMTASDRDQSQVALVRVATLPTNLRIHIAKFLYHVWNHGGWGLTKRHCFELERELAASEQNQVESSGVEVEPKWNRSKRHHSQFTLQTFSIDMKFEYITESRANVICNTK